MSEFRRFKRRCCAIPIRFEAIEAFLQDIVEIGYAVFDKSVQAFEPIVSLCHLTLQSHDTLVLAFGFYCMPRLHGGQHHRKTFRLKQALDKMFGDKAIQLVHSDGAPLTERLSFSGIGRAGVIAMNSAAEPVSIRDQGDRAIGGAFLKSRVSFGGPGWPSITSPLNWLLN